MNLVLLNKLEQSYFLISNYVCIYVTITVLIFTFLLRYSSILRIFPASLSPAFILKKRFFSHVFIYLDYYLLFHNIGSSVITPQSKRIADYFQ